MGAIELPRPVLRLAAVFSRHADALHWARRKLVEAWGPICLEGEPYAFTETSYYDRSMGTGLQKQLLAFQTLADPAELADWKLAAGRWEEEYRRSSDATERRPLNIDPGYLTEAKLVLATTKNRDHRIYLRDGIFAEVTLYFRSGRWHGREWTYADYQRPEVHAFLLRCRQYLRGQLARPAESEEGGSPGSHGEE